MTTAMDEMREMNRSLAEIGGFVRERADDGDGGPCAAESGLRSYPTLTSS